MRYIEMNPVRAKIVSSPDQYLWSSYKANAIGETNSLIKVHPLYISLGSNNERRQLAYQQLFSQELPQRTVNDIRIKTNGGWVLGTDLFVTQFENNTNRRLNPLPKGGDHLFTKEKMNRWLAIAYSQPEMTDRGLLLITRRLALSATSFALSSCGLKH